MLFRGTPKIVKADKYTGGEEIFKIYMQQGLCGQVNLSGSGIIQPNLQHNS